MSWLLKSGLIILAIIGVIWLLGSAHSGSPAGSYSPTPFGYDSDYEEPNDDPPITSDNWECTSDCSGHEAGYEWASDQGITDPEDCGGKSNSFIEGCKAYANEHQMEGYDNDYDDY